MKRYLLLAVLSFALLLHPSHAKVPYGKTPSDAQQTAVQPPDKSSTPDESDLIEHKSYINKDGNQVHSPAHTKSGKAPEGATAQCRDGSYSFSKHHSGTCSHHGGVGRWLN
jgi:hypothetical protein